MKPSHTFFRAGSFWERSSISKGDCLWRVPKFLCPVCLDEEFAFQFAYPHLDPRNVLSNDEFKTLFRRTEPQSIDPDFIMSCIKRLEDAFHIPVTAGTRFGPARIAVTTKPKDDFDVSLLAYDFFIRRPAAVVLRSEGFDLSWVEPKASGKYAVEADFVQLVVPVVAHCTVPEGFSFCHTCKRRKGIGPARDRGDAKLIVGPEISGLPFFKAVEFPALILSAGFISTANRLDLKGFQLGETLFPQLTE